MPYKIYYQTVNNLIYIHFVSKEVGVLSCSTSSLKALELLQVVTLMK